MLDWSLYLVDGPGIAEDEVDGPLDEAFSKVMPPTVIEQSVLRPVEPTAIEGCLVSGNSECNCLSSDIAR